LWLLRSFGSPSACRAGRRRSRREDWGGVFWK
jgi:hypothetical protein